MKIGLFSDMNPKNIFVNLLGHLNLSVKTCFKPFLPIPFLLLLLTIIFNTINSLFPLDKK